MISEQEVKRLLASVDAVVTNSHFVLTAGGHSSAYINKDAISTDTTVISELCRALAEYFAHSDVDVVVSPAIGAIPFSQWTTHHLRYLQQRKVLAVYADKTGEGENAGFIIKRSYEKLIPGKRVAVIEDLTTTGLTTRQTVAAVRALGGFVVGVGAIANRGSVTLANVGDPPFFKSLLNVKMDVYKADSCPLCKQGIPINTSLGHGKDFLAKKQRA
jgi:orotate phosphoribosyltransferase